MRRVIARDDHIGRAARAEACRREAVDGDLDRRRVLGRPRDGDGCGRSRSTLEVTDVERRDLGRRGDRRRVVRRVGRLGGLGGSRAARVVDRSVGACRPAEGRAFEVRARDRRVREVRAREVGAGEVGIDDLRPGEVRLGEVRIAQVGSLEVGARERRPREVGAGQVRAGQVDACTRRGRLDDAAVDRLRPVGAAAAREQQSRSPPSAPTAPSASREPLLVRSIGPRS